MITALCEILEIKHYMAYDWILDHQKTWPTLIFVIMLIGLLINPFNTMERAFRYELLYSFYLNIISPFGQVRFKEFFLGDILTSMVRPLIDVYFIGCFFTSEEWKYAALQG
jgi:hypothetical protein